MNEICMKCKKENNTKYKTCNDCREKDRNRKNKNPLIKNSSFEEKSISTLSLRESIIEESIIEEESNNITQLSNNLSICSNDEYTNNQKLLNSFKIKDEIKIDKTKTIDFIHPFSAKLFGSRGSGKTTFIINYLNQLIENNLNQFNEIFFITNSETQDLLNLLKCEVNFLKFNEIEEIRKYDQKTLFIFDDVMSDLKNNKIIQNYYTRGRHCNISIFSLEQHMNYSSNVERGNCDYFLLFKIHDYDALSNFHKKFCLDISFDGFLQMLYKCKLNNFPLIISNNFPFYKYRYNFNISLKELIIKDENDKSIIKIISDKIIKEKKIKEITKIKRKKESRKWYITLLLLLTCIPCIIGIDPFDKTIKYNKRKIIEYEE